MMVKRLAVAVAGNEGLFVRLLEATINLESTLQRYATLLIGQIEGRREAYARSIGAAENRHRSDFSNKHR